MHDYVLLTLWHDLGVMAFSQIEKLRQIGNTLLHKAKTLRPIWLLPQRDVGCCLHHNQHLPG